MRPTPAARTRFRLGNRPFGDSFDVLDALFASLAFAVIVVSWKPHREDLKLPRKNIRIQQRGRAVMSTDKPVSESSQVAVKTTLITVIGSVLVAGATTLGTIYGTDSKVESARNEASKTQTDVETLKKQIDDATAAMKQELLHVKDLKKQIDDATTTMRLLSVPVGTIIAYAGPVTDETDLKSKGWLPCDGREVSRTDHSALFEVIKEAWGEGNRGTTFHLPDLRGVFLRGVNNKRTGEFADPDANKRPECSPGGNRGNDVGSCQLDEFKEHKHDWKFGLDRDDKGGGGGAKEFTQSSNKSHWTPPIDFAGGNETRPKNAYVNYLIKF